MVFSENFVSVYSESHKWVGIPTCVGIAPTKTLAKFCNHLAKRYSNHSNHFNGVVVWSDWSTTIQRRALASQPVAEIWGIGYQTAAKLMQQGIIFALDFVEVNTATLRRRYGVLLERIQRELQGISCDVMQLESENKQQIIRSRSFNGTVNRLEPLQSAITHHVSAAAKKLRAEKIQAHTVGVFIYTNSFSQDASQYGGHKWISMPYSTSDTLELNQVVQTILRKIYRPGYAYKKCGIELGGIEPAQGAQMDLWRPRQPKNSQQVMATWDLINKRFDPCVMKLGSELLDDDWKMARNLLSPCFTTRITDAVLVE